MELKALPFKHVVYGPLREMLIKVQDLGGAVCGGYARHLCSGGKFGDIDIFTSNAESYNLIRDYFADRRDVSLKRKKYNHYGFEIENYKYKYSRFNKGFAIQIIDTKESPRQVIQEFDITVSQAIADFKHCVCYVTPEFIRDEAEKMLRFTLASKDSDQNAVWRIEKYNIDYKYKITLDELTNFYLNLADADKQAQFIDQIKDSALSDSHHFIKQLEILADLDSEVKNRITPDFDWHDVQAIPFRGA